MANKERRERQKMIFPGARPCMSKRRTNRSNGPADRSLCTRTHHPAGARRGLFQDWLHEGRVAVEHVPAEEQAGGEQVPPDGSHDRHAGQHRRQVHSGAGRDCWTTAEDSRLQLAMARVPTVDELRLLRSRHLNQGSERHCWLTVD